MTNARVEELAPTPDRYSEIRRRMVEEQVRGRGIRDERVLAVMSDTPRHPFVPAFLRYRAYDDTPVPIGEGQTISQPYIVAAMLAALELTGSERVLEVGTGSGYQAALLAKLAREVISIEILPTLAERATRALELLGLANVRVVTGDGSDGYPETAPYDAIVVAAACPALPAALAQQLADGGRLVLPLGERDEQTIVRIRRQNQRLLSERIEPCVFVPLTGRAGFVDGHASPR